LKKLKGGSKQDPNLFYFEVFGESYYDAIYLCQAMLEALIDSNPKVNVLPLVSQLTVLTVAKDWAKSNFVKFTKYCTAYPLARYQQNELPPKPIGFEGSPFFTGAWKRILKSRVISFSDKNSSLFWTILQGVKRGCADVSKETMSAAYADHNAQMSQPPAGKEPTPEHQVLYKKTFETMGLFQNKLFEASSSSSFGTVKSKGGGRNEIRSEYDPGYSGDFFNQVNSVSYDLLKMVEVRPGKVREIRSVASPSLGEVTVDALSLNSVDEPTSFLKKLVQTNGRTAVEFINRLLPYAPVPDFTDEVGTAESLEDAVDMILEESEDFESLDVMVHALAEPIKVRLITKGESKPYWVAKTAQKGLYEHLVQYAPFALLYQPLSQLHLIQLVDRVKALGLFEEFNLWVSGDYKSATDLIDIRHTKMSFEEALVKGVNYTHPAELKTVLRSVLYEQNLHYPPKENLPRVKQVSGQLMGSPLSFPILCVINLVGFWITLERYTGRKFEINQLPCLINGDDILFKSSLAFYEMWKIEVADLGFKLSIGKNYIHKKLLTANSVLFRDLGDGFFKQIPYLNIGLLTSMAKKTGSKTIKAKPIWDYYNGAVSGAFDPARAHRRFVHYNKQAIQRSTTRKVVEEDKSINLTTFNMFLPVERGGLGFNCPSTVEYKTTPFQRRWATYLRKQMKDDPSTFTKLTLVKVTDEDSTTTRSAPTLERDHVLVLQPKIGPHEQQFTEPKSDLIRLPPLAGEVSLDQTIFSVSVPTGAQIKAFRKENHREMGGKIKTFNYRLVELRKIPDIEIKRPVFRENKTTGKKFYRQDIKVKLPTC